MKKLMILFCRMFGHRSICLHRYHWDSGNNMGSEVSSWVCERCGHKYTEQWDY